VSTNDRQPYQGQQGLHELWGIGYEVFGGFVDLIDGEDCIFAYERMAMLLCASSDLVGFRFEKQSRAYKARTDGGDQGFEQLRLSNLLEETQGSTADVLVGMLEIVTDRVAVSLDSVHGAMARFETADAHQTRIISCLSFPCSSSLGQTSQ
jgi:hypothetical protein